MPAGVQTRWYGPENPDGARGKGGSAFAGRKGRQSVALKAGESVTIAQAEKTSGVVRRIWATIDQRSPQMLRGLKIEFFWDGAIRPAASVPFGDFFGTGLGRLVPFQSALFSNPEGRSFNACVPMPFRKGMRIVVTNECEKDLGAFYYEVNVTIGDAIADDALYFHAYWNRENPTTLRRDFQILPRVSGRGRFLGCNLGVIADRRQYSTTWWGEGEVKIFVDGDRELPSLCGTGTEDYIGTAWGQGRYDHLYQGCHLAEAEKFHYCFYRYHIPDPVWFHRDILVAIQQIGCWSPDTRWWMSQQKQSFEKAGPIEPGTVDWQKDDRPYALFERVDDWSSCAYFYLNTTTNDLPPLASYTERIAGLV